MNIMMAPDGVIHAVPHDSVRCATLCDFGTPESMHLVEQGHKPTCKECIAVMAKAEQNGWNWTMPWRSDSHKHYWSAADTAELIAHWYGISAFPQIWGQFGPWLARGDGVAIYRNHDLSSASQGEPRLVSYGSAQAQLEMDNLPQRLPDIGNAINWRFSLEGVYKPESHDTSAMLSDLIGVPKYNQIMQEEVEADAKDPRDILDYSDTDDDEDEWPEEDWELDEYDDFEDEPYDPFD